ncbi:cytochrome aa3 quinol oxidase subunit IV [Halobacillus sp. A1]|uniref:Quinol oxidase subunit 4 n=1 Tax=Halobacillus campisalis TaxID=435909 RepID=A0ABW2K0J6_9BACI|nr:MULTISPECIES: cytochrome aa3 quinol oxidase subunit IV [Halobacillus]MCP3033472.1 cytochrome aa3 quinol oxidase subunit IV [Halobacillus sp. A1]
MTDHNKRIPTQHVIGFALSIALTLLAAWTALGSNLSTMWIISSIMILAVIQAGIQLFMFMHVVESDSHNGHVPWNMMFHGAVLAAILVAGSLFVMSFGFTHDHDGENHEQHEQQDSGDHSDMDMEGDGEHEGH